MHHRLETLSSNKPLSNGNRRCNTGEGGWLVSLFTTPRQALHAYGVKRAEDGWCTLPWPRFSTQPTPGGAYRQKGAHITANVAIVTTPRHSTRAIPTSNDGRWPEAVRFCMVFGGASVVSSSSGWQGLMSFTWKHLASKKKKKAGE